MPATPARHRRRLLGTALATTLLATACTGGPNDDPQAAAAGPAADPVVDDFEAVRERARGQTVRWWLFGGDDRINAYIDDHVAPAAAAHGVTIERVPVTDTADATQRVVAEARAGETQARST